MCKDTDTQHSLCLRCDIVVATTRLHVEWDDGLCSADVLELVGVVRHVGSDAVEHGRTDAAL